MWKLLFLLWIIPIGVGIVAFARMMDEMPALKDNERKLLFDETKQTEFGIWLGLTFAVLAVGFFTLGLIQGIILPNLSSFWFVVVPLLTAAAAIFVLGLWLRSVRLTREDSRRRFLAYRRVLLESQRRYLAEER